MTADPRPPAPADAWLVLDVDDTLVATYRTGFAKCIAAAASLGLALPPEAAFASLYGRVTFEECVQRLHPGIDLARYQDSYDSLVTQFPPEPLCDGSALLAATTRASLRRGILTNGPAVKTARKLAACGLAPDDFDFVISGDTALIRKPAAGSFAALRKHGVNLETAWYVSDSAAEWKAAESAGLRTVGVSTRQPAESGFLPMLWLPGSALLPGVVPCLAASAQEPRPGPPRAVTFDAGFTLIEPALEADEIVWRHLALADGAPSLPAVRAAFEAAATILARPEVWWASPGHAEQNLTRFYEAVLTDLGAPSRTTAAEVINAYTTPANWRAVPGARDLLAAVRTSGCKIGVLSNWQPSLGEVLRSTGLDSHVDAVIPSTIAGAAKPAREAFQAAADALGTAVQHLVHVGDHLVDDVSGALRAGCRAVLAGGPLGDLTVPLLSAGSERI